MLYPANIEQKLGFDKIRELLKQACVSSLGEAFVDKMKFSANFDLIEKLTKQTTEFLHILQTGESFPEQHFFDVSQALQKAQIEGSCLTEEEIFDIKLSLQTIAQCLQFFQRKGAENYIFLQELVQGIVLDKQIIKQIDLVIDERGKIRDNASPELVRIRKSLTEEQNNLRKKLETLLRTAKQDGLTKDDANLTIRDGRMVIPLLAEAKRKMKGFVHDESATGQTVYVEPTEVFDMNNEIRNLSYQERREILRILTELTQLIRPQVPTLQKAYHFLGMIDFIRAKARFALKIEAHNPLFVKGNLLKWQWARHPLLHLTLKAQGKKVEPLDIEITHKQRIILISGPNAGGKSVALQTIGLLQYMYQCGLLVSMSPDATIGIFQDIFIDMGDEQSIENDLSTYSSHLKNMQYFLNFATAKTLFLIDEFGTGTEPAMGGAIAEAILERLHQQKAAGVITTHYTNLKHFAEHKEGIANAAMRYDVRKLEPLYALEIGKPGSSFAFEIAQKIGLPAEVIQKARQLVGTKQADFDKLLAELELEKKAFQEKNSFIQSKEKRLAQTIEQYEKLKSFLETERKKMLNQVKEEAKKLLKEANQKIENTIRAIKENQAEKEITKQIRQDLQDFSQQYLQIEPVVITENSLQIPDNEQEEPIEVIEGNIAIGDTVRIKGQSAMAEVVALKGKDAEILIGELKSFVKINRLERLNRKQIRQQNQQKQRSYTPNFDINEKMVNFHAELDLRGMRGEEALEKTEEFIDTAILLGMPELRILHGKGDGILRNLIRNRLRRYKEILKMEDDHADSGGAGVTIVGLK